MRKAFVMLLVLAGATAFLANSAIARMNEDEMIPARLQDTNLHKEFQSRASRLGTSATSSTDTVWIGYTPGNQDLTYNYWSVGARTGAQGGGQGRDQVGQWGFDPPYVDGDSLQGWWPVREWYGTTAGQVRPDYQRPWWAIDLGNNVDYVINGSSGRTFGVTGMWHRDDAGAPVPANKPGGGTYTWNNLAGATPNWSVLEGNYSAWMGLRALHDVRFVDPITGQPYSGEARKFNSGGQSYFGDFTGPHGLDYANNSSFPGYMSQMDQMLYRDIDLSGIGSDDLNLSFMYTTEMSTGYNNSASTRVGWFNYDPLQPTYDGTTTSSNLAVGNFISSTDAGTDAPIDSFMVYVGAPVGSSFLGSDGFTYDVYDPQRRWFSEVIRCTEDLYKEVFTTFGEHQSPVTVNATVSNATLAPILAASSGKLRLVFRVKTNRTWDDEHSTWESILPGAPPDTLPGSAGRGAVQVDAVTYSHGATNSPAGWGDFEASNSIDNSLAVDALDAWKSTGKPPETYVHAEALSALAYGNLCGPEDAETAQCDMSGVVLTFGDHDHSEASGGIIEGQADRELMKGCYSPTILMATPAMGTNAIGLTRDGSDPTEDYYIKMDTFTGFFAGGSKGNWFRYSFQAYPTLDRNGNDGWMTPNYPPYIVFQPDPICTPDLIDFPVLQNDMLRTTTATGIPDSAIIGCSQYQSCFRTSLPTCGFTQGGYFDNITLAVVDGTPSDLTCSIWDFYNDSFPANETAGLPGTAGFDTTTAYVKTGRSISQSNTTSLSSRYMVPGDSAVVITTDPTMETYMVFRILPGPGNYVDVGHPELGNGLRAVRPGTGIGPADDIPATPGDPTDFFESYMNDNGTHGTPGGHVGHVWNPNVWNSARCDTAGANTLFPQAGTPTSYTGAQNSKILQSTYHDLDPRGHGGQLGVLKPLCFYPSAIANVQTVDCTIGPPSQVTGGGPQTSPYVPSGWPGDHEPNGLWVFVGAPTFTVKTYEDTKILPDGAFTPGTHIEYFFARYAPGAPNGTAADAMLPDTNTVFPQIGEGNSDGHRWQEFSILPDLWKTDGFVHPVTGETGIGLAAMLVVDGMDRWGGERTWVGIADTIGATSVTRQGAHNGWHATANDGGASINDPANFVAAHLGQPGTTWDMYQIKASESTDTPAGHIGVRLGKRGDGSNPQIDYKESRLGPTPEMLNAYYKIMMYNSANNNYRVLGPFTNQSADDPAVMEAFLNGDPGATEATRGMWTIGDGFVEDGYVNSDDGSGVPEYLNATLGVDLKSNNYQAAATNTEPTSDISVEPTMVGGYSGYADGFIAVRTLCIWTNDVLERSVTLSAFTEDGAFYDPHGSANAPFPSSIYKKWDTTSKYIAWTDGFDIRHLTGHENKSDRARHLYAYMLFANIFGTIADINGTAIGSLDVPNVGDNRQFNFVSLRNNPVESGMANIYFGLAKADRVQVKVFDVSGRLVRTLADRVFTAGEHNLFWDGADDGGHKVARGVYFTQFFSQKNNLEKNSKVTLLR